MKKEELKIRQTIWEAISNFYLDTDLNDLDYNYITKILNESNLELDELKLIDLYEVFPSLNANLLSPAGEWSGFDSIWLNETCLFNYEKRMRSQFFRKYMEIKNRLYFRLRKKHWTEIEKRLKNTT